MRKVIFTCKSRIILSEAKVCKWCGSVCYAHVMCKSPHGIAIQRIRYWQCDNQPVWQPTPVSPTFPNCLGGILLVCYKGYLSRTNPVEKASVAICCVKKHKMPTAGCDTMPNSFWPIFEMYWTLALEGSGQHSFAAQAHSVAEQRRVGYSQCKMAAMRDFVAQNSFFQMLCVF